MKFVRKRMLSRILTVPMRSEWKRATIRISWTDYLTAPHTTFRTSPSTVEWLRKSLQTCAILEQAGLTRKCSEREKSWRGKNQRWTTWRPLVERNIMVVGERDWTPLSPLHLPPPPPRCLPSILPFHPPPSQHLARPTASFYTVRMSMISLNCSMKSISLTQCSSETSQWGAYVCICKCK